LKPDTSKANSSGERPAEVLLAKWTYLTLTVDLLDANCRQKGANE